MIVKLNWIMLVILLCMVGYGIITMRPEQQVQVLSEKIEAVKTPEVTPEITSTAIPTIFPTLTPVPTKKPTPKPTITSTPSPTSIPTPVGTPGPTPDVWSPSSMEPFFGQYAGAYGVDKNTLERIANCESHFNANAKNGDYLGLFQFSTSTWISYRSQMGMDTNPVLRTNIEESIRTGAFLVSKRGVAPWPKCVEQ